MSAANTPQSTKKTKVELEHLFETAWQDGMGCANNPNYKKRTQLLTQKALTILKETLEEALPEKKTITKYEGKRQSLQQGWNNAIDQTKANLNNLLGGDDNDLL